MSSEPLTSVEVRVLKLMKFCPGILRHQAELIIESESTQAQSKFTLQVLEFLKTIKFTGSVEVNTLVVLHEKVTNKFGDKEDRFRIRFADILFPELGLVIEVDGRSHDKELRKMNCDNAREEFYVRAGFVPPYRIDNEDALIPRRSTRNIKEAMTLILELKKQLKAGKRSEFTPARCLAQGRSAFYKSNPGLLDLFPHLRSETHQVGIWKKHHMGLRARFHEGTPVLGKKRPSKQEKKTMGINGVNPKKRGRPCKVQRDQVALRVEELQRQNPQRTLESIAAELGYSSRQLRRIRAANLMSKMKMVAWT